jgi:hypothetical protein
MADKTIDQLIAATAALLTQEFEVYDSSGAPKSQKVTGQQIVDLIRKPDFTSPLILLGATDLSKSAAHGLGVTPRLFKCYIVVSNPFGGYSVGNLINAESAFDSAVMSNYTVSADATLITLSMPDDIEDPNILISNKNGFGTTNPCDGTAGNIRLQFLAWR